MVGSKADIIQCIATSQAAALFGRATTGLHRELHSIRRNKPNGEDYSVKEFDRQIASGKTVLERLLVNRSVDLSHP